MAFRISDATIFNNAIRNARLNRFDLSKLHSQLSSGKRVNSLADDPSDASRILKLRRGATRLEQFSRNIDSARGRLEPVEQALPTPTAEPSPKPTTYQPKSALPAGSINLNTATASELQRLPRIGPKMAARILAHREAHGPFRRVQDLVQVRGIGTKTLARLAPYLVVEEPEE